MLILSPNPDPVLPLLEIDKSPPKLQQVPMAPLPRLDIQREERRSSLPFRLGINLPHRPQFLLLRLGPDQLGLHASFDPFGRMLALEFLERRRGFRR